MKTTKELAFEIYCEAANVTAEESTDADHAKWTALVLESIKILLPANLEIISEREGCGSSYHDFRLPGRQWMVQVRISNHKQRYGGSIWSFEPTDNAATFAIGLETVISAINEADLED